MRGLLLVEPIGDKRRKRFHGCLSVQSDTRFETEWAINGRKNWKRWKPAPEKIMKKALETGLL